MKHLLKLNCKAQETQVTKKYELDPSKLLPVRFCPISLDFQHLFEPSGVSYSFPHFTGRAGILCSSRAGQEGKFRFSSLLEELGDPTAMGAENLSSALNLVTILPSGDGWV